MDVIDLKSGLTRWPRRLPLLVLAHSLVLSPLGTLAPPAAAAGAAAPVRGGIVGSWASTRGSERLVFMASGHFRSCFVGSPSGNAAMGQWTRLAPGRYTVEFTHTANADCKAPLQPIHKHPASIVGQVMINQGELALYVSGEFPPDLYRPVVDAGGR